MDTSTSLISSQSSARVCGPPIPQQCGRCRLFFPGDPAFDQSVTTTPKWWACPECHRALFPDGPSRHLMSRR